ncbi:MAG: prolyl oligopeptidase family serine peptidase [Bacteroidetes bacterium]|nr:prolyl oligopeptidase family serine peptidase [Bacteroidota bacterium]
MQCAQKDSFKKPPLAKVEVVEDSYFGIKILDHYRYMENMEDIEVQNWFKSQTDYSRLVLNNIPGRQSLIDKMHEFDRRKASKIRRLRITDNNRYFYLKTTPDDETSKLYYRDGYEGREIFLYDPKTFSSDTNQIFNITSISPSYDGSKVALEVAPNGSGNKILLTMDVESKKLFPEQIDRCWFAIPSWLPDGEAYLYIRLQSDDMLNIDSRKNSKIYLHKIGTDPSEDKEIFSRSKYPELGIRPEDFPRIFYDKTSNYLFIYAWNVDRRKNVFYAPVTEINKEKIDWKHLFKIEDEVYDFYPTEKHLYIYTPKNAPNFKLLKTSLKNPDLKNAEIVVIEPSDATLTNFGLTDEGLYYTLATNGVEERLFHKSFSEKIAKEILLPFNAGTIYLHTKGIEYSEIWVMIFGWSDDSQRYRYLHKTNEFKLENLSDTAEFPEYSDLVVEEIMVESHDGVNVPLSLIYKKGIEKDGGNRVLFYGYGSYGSSLSPFFRPNYLLWTNEGGILAFAHVRGGGELGDKWHKAGYKTTKPNTWKDLIASAEYLIAKGYTSKQYIAITGGSAGGILIGRALIERPDLFAAAIPTVGMLNPLRSEETPNGPINAPEFGTVKDSVECMALIEMDPYLQLEVGKKYPATLITTGMNDPNVIAWMPAKFAARLQSVNTSDKPILFWADYKGGHGIGSTKSKQYENLADQLSFALWQTGHPKFQIN